MSSELGKLIKVNIFGESHGESIGCVIDGLPGGFEIDFNKLDSFLDRRRSKNQNLTTGRKEDDKPEFVSGIMDNVTTGFPICAVIKNKDVRSKDYSEILDKPRPAHADYTAFVKYKGYADMRGGGHFSGRLTAPLCVAGGISKQILEKNGIYIGAHLKSVGDVKDDSFTLEPTGELFEEIANKEIAVINDNAGEKMKQIIKDARLDNDSVGGIIECAVIGLPEGIGNPMFEGIESRISSGIFSIPAVKGVEFGMGFESTLLRGSENNDEFYIEDDKIKTKTNNCGGILGGITDGMPLIFKAAVKPTPSIEKKQKTISLSKIKETEIEIKGRHDPCVALRAVVVVEAVTAIILLDMLMEAKAYGTF